MHLDFLSLACLRAELVPLEGGRIQQVVQPTERSLALELYAGQRVTLLLDAHPAHARALLQEDKGRRGVERDTPLGLLMRKWVRGGRLRAVRQPPWERILELDIETEEGRSTLVAEIMGRDSNLLLLDEARVIRECVRRADAQTNAYRVTLPGKPYVQPPPLLKPPAPTLGLDGWRRLLATAEADQPLHRLLPRALTAVSPTLARELAARVAGDAEATVGEIGAEALAAAVAALFAPLESGQWAPHVALDEEGSVLAFAPYELTQFERSEPAPSLSDAIRRFFDARMDGDAYAAARQRVAALLADATRRTESTLYALRAQKVDNSEVERLREKGELLLAYNWQVARGASTVEVPDFEGKPRRITLDPTQSAIENAQRLFARYEKKKRAADEVPPRVEEAEQVLAFLQGLGADLQAAEERPEIEAVREALVAAGLSPATARRRGGGGVLRGPRRVLLGDEWVALVGRNSQQNDEVTFRHGSADDLWLHARGVPGSHVILKSAGRPVPPPIVERAAALAAYYSQARASTEVAVDVTERRHVRRLSGARPGLVHYRNEQTLHVRPLDAEAAEEE